MSEKFQNRYRIGSCRLPNWDYGWNAAYFVTICTKNRKCYFGDVIDETMHLSEMGQMTHKFWLEIPQHFPFVILDEFIVMPNHVHGIIIINKTDDERDLVETQHFVSLPKNKFGPQSMNLASIIRGFKSAVTINGRKIDAGFAWQPRYYEHIIRNNRSFERIRTYIHDNPLKWDTDRYR